MEIVQVKNVPEHYKFMKDNATRNKYFVKMLIGSTRIKGEWWQKQLKLINKKRKCSNCDTIYTEACDSSRFRCLYHPGIFIQSRYSCCGRGRSGRGCQTCDHNENDTILCHSLLLFLTGKLKWPPLRNAIRLEYKRDENERVIIHESNLLYKTTNNKKEIKNV